MNVMKKLTGVIALSMLSLATFAQNNEGMLIMDGQAPQRYKLDFAPKYQTGEGAIVFLGWTNSKREKFYDVTTVYFFNVRDGVVTVGCKGGNREVKVGEYFGCPTDPAASTQSPSRWLLKTIPLAGNPANRVQVAALGAEKPCSMEGALICNPD